MAKTRLKIRMEVSQIKFSALHLSTFLVLWAKQLPVKSLVSIDTDVNNQIIFRCSALKQIQSSDAQFWKPLFRIVTAIIPWGFNLHCWFQFPEVVFLSRSWLQSSSIRNDWNLLGFRTCGGMWECYINFVNISTMLLLFQTQNIKLAYVLFFSTAVGTFEPVVFVMSCLRERFYWKFLFVFSFSI